MSAQNLPTPTSEIPTPPHRPDDAHKGQCGHVAIIAGSRGMTGAAILTGLGALRTGAGLARCCCPASVLPIIASSEPCLMTVPLDEDAEGRIRELPDDAVLNWAHAVVTGPGLGQSGDLPDLTEQLLAACAPPLVVDADGLNNLAPRGVAPWKPRHDRPTVITPHPGEMRRLRDGLGLGPRDGNDDATRLRCAHEVAVALHCTVVLKGHRTVVSSPGATYVNTTGNAGMATGGMGDVLSGIIGALLGQGLAAFDAARLGVHIHGLAGDYCEKHVGRIGYVARELADMVPAALAEASRPRIGFR